MADQQITQLPEETGTVASTFPLAIVNVTAAETRKITTANLATAIFSNLSAGGLAASKVAAGYSGTSLTDGTVTNAKLVSSSVNFGGVSVALGAQDLTPSFNLQDATGYPASALTGTITNAQLAGSIAVSKLASSAVSFGGISVVLGNSDATPAFDLTDATNYPASSLTGTITNAQLAGSIDVSKLVGSNVSFGGVTVALGASDPTPQFDLQDATGYKTTNLVGTITNAQLAGSIDASKLVANSLTTDQLGPNCVGSSELANNAVDSGAVQTGAIVNDKIETSSSSTTGIDGSTKLRAGSLPASKLDASTVGNGLAINSNVLSINNTITGATSLGLTFSNQGICTGISALQASDLSGVLATSSAVGVVKVPSSGGLSVSGSGDLSLASTVTAHTTRGIAVNAFGQVTSVSATVPSASLPVASTTAVGGIKVPSTSSPLTVDGNGVLTIGVSGVTAGTGFTKFNVNDKGLVTSAGAITAAEIPNISAALLTSGSLDVARIANDSIGREKFSNNSTCIFGSVAQAGFPSISDSYRGELFFDTTEEDLYINDSNAWQPVTTLTKGSLKLGGVYSAATSAVTSVTSHGASVGLTVGQNLPTPTSNTDSTYLIVGAGGTPSGIPNGPTGELIPPDYLLSLTSSTGSSWVEIDLSTTVSSPTASNVSVVSGYGGSSTNVQTALAEVYTDFLKLGGGNITGELKIESSGSLAFEGTANAYETRLTVVDPGSADRLITFPDATGTVVLQGQTSVVTSAMIDSSLVNANIAANAAIALSKLAAVSAGQILVGASGTGAITAVTPTGDIALSSAGAFSYVAGSISNADINGSANISASKIDVASVSQAGCVQLSSAVTSTSATKAATPAAIKTVNDALTTTTATADAALPKSGGALTGNLTLNAQSLVRFADSDSSNFIALKAPATIASDITLTLPSAAPAANQILKSNGSTPTTLEWAADGSATALQLTGGTLSGALNMGANNITNGGTITGTFVGNVTGNISGTSGGFTAGSASNLSSGTVATARLGSGTASSSNFLRGDNTWQTIDLTALSASNLTSGTVPDARFPSTLPAVSGANLTNVNATTLDSIDSGSFVRSDASDSLSGATYNFDGSTAQKMIFSGVNNPYIRFQEGTTNKAWIGWDPNGYLTLSNTEDDSALLIRDNLTFSPDQSNWYSVWHAGNDGSGSGLDADTLDGFHAGNLLSSDNADQADGDITFNGGAGAVTIAANSDIRFASGSWSGEATKIQHHSNWLYLVGGSNGIYFRSQAGANRWRIDSSGHFEPDNDNALNIGDTSNRVANVYATTFHGDGSNLTNLPASGGTITATASGSVAANTAVIVNGSGTVKTIAGYTDGITLRIPVITSDAQDTNYSIQFAEDPVNNRIIGFYRTDSAGGMQYYVVGTRNGISITWGTPARAGTCTGADDVGIVNIGSDKFFLVAKHNAPDNQYFCKVVTTTSSNTATFGTAVALADLSNNNQTAIIAPKLHYNSDTGAIILVYGSNSGLYGQMFTVSGTTITSGSVVEIGGSTYKPTEIDAAWDNFNKVFLVFFNKTNRKIYTTFVKEPSSGTTVTVGSIGTNFSSITGDYLSVVFDPIRKVAFFLYRNNADTRYSYFAGIYGGTSVTVSSNRDFAIPFSSSSPDHSDMEAMQHAQLTYISGPGEIFLTFKGNTNAQTNIQSGTRYGYYIVGTSTGTVGSTDATITWSTTDKATWTATDYDARYCRVIATANFAFIGHHYDAGSPSKQISARVRRFEGTDMTTSNFIGFSDGTSYSDGQTVTVNVVGNTTTQSSLTAGEKYYVQNDGTLSTTAADPSVVAGTAISSTKILIKG